MNNTIKSNLHNLTVNFHEISPEAELNADLEKTDWVTSIPFFALHVLAFGGLFFFEWSMPLILLCLGSYYLRMFAVTAGYHRYFSHRTFKTSRVFQFLLAFLAQASVQKGVLWWAANHRHHHRYSDLPQDLHSPVQRGFWWSHVGWILCNRYDNTQTNNVRDLVKFKELRFINKYYLLPVFSYGLALYLLAGWSGFFWGFVVSTVLLWHGTFTVNSLTHVWGSRRYATNDESRNNFWIALITMGEGWHNNHHHYMNSTRQGFRWYEIDMTYYVLRGLAFLGIVYDLKEPPAQL